jgi:hypothetical protein
MAFEADGYFFKKAGSVNIMSTDNRMLFIYNRKNYSIKNQNSYKMTKSLRKKVCSDKELKTSINAGSMLTFVYIYDDGVITIPVDECY